MGSYVLSTNNAAPFSMEERQQVIYFFIFSAILPALTPVDQTEHQIQFQEHHDPSNEPSRPGLIIIRKSTPNCSASNSFVPRLITDRTSHPGECYLRSYYSFRLPVPALKRLSVDVTVANPEHAKHLMYAYLASTISPFRCIISGASPGFRGCAAQRICGYMLA